MKLRIVTTEQEKAIDVCRHVKEHIEAWRPNWIMRHGGFGDIRHSASFDVQTDGSILLKLDIAYERGKAVDLILREVSKSIKAFDAQAQIEVI
ncbi:MAG: hypothetical protein NT016_01680 [Candidatus Aenigmarchaeota archaeon]|nr:hypothetical protein [Candidatus Aenigmarchaeota archaeon]